MFTTVNNVKQYTNLDVTVDLITRAQAIIEVFIGKSEIDITDTNDFLILDKMTAYQAGYMLDNEEVIYKQIASLSEGRNDAAQTFDTKMSAPWMAPLAVLASHGLTFNRGRSIRTGRIFQMKKDSGWRAN